MAQSCSGASQPVFTPAPVRMNRSSARALGTFVPALTRPVFEKFGFPAAALLTDWAAIAGPDIAACTTPLRLSWRNRRAGPGDEGGANRAAMLILGVDSARALELQHRLGLLRERINAYFGYDAVCDIRLQQIAIEPRSQTRPKAPRRARPLPLLDTIRDPELRSALSRLGAAISA